MKNAIFIDTGAFIALADKTDQYHAQACELATEVEKTGPRVTSIFILLETSLYFQRRLSLEVSQRFWHSLVSGEAQVELLAPESSDLERAHQISQHYADQTFSWVDCTSFALMERHKIDRAFAFDQDFLVFQLPRGPIRRLPA